MSNKMLTHHLLATNVYRGAGNRVKYIMFVELRDTLIKMPRTTEQNP